MCTIILADSDLLTGIVRIDDIDVSGVPIKVCRAQDPDQIRLQHTGSNVVSNKLPVNAPGGAIGAVISVLAEGNTGIIHPDNVCGGFLIRRVHNQDLIRLAVVIGIVHHDITAQLAGDLLRHCPCRICQCGRCIVCLIGCFLNTGDRAGNRCSDRAELNIAIPIR